MSRLSLLVALAVSFVATSSALAHDYSHDTLLLGWMKLKGEDFDYEANAESYLRLYRPDTWAKVKDDEFKLEDEKKKTVAIMQRKVKEFDLTQEFTLDTKMTFQKYDAEEKHFPLVTRWRGDTATKTTYWYPDSRYPNGTLPYQMRVYFSNPEMLASLPMDQETARAFVNGRKEYDRVVTVRIQFRLISARESAGESLAQIQSITIYDTIGKKRLIHRAAKTDKDKKKDDKEK